MLISIVDLDEKRAKMTDGQMTHKPVEKNTKTLIFGTDKQKQEIVPPADTETPQQ